MKLYVERKVLNADDIHNWYHLQGVTNLIDPSQYHVTVARSSADVNLVKMDFDANELTIEQTEPLFTSVFGDYFVHLILTNIDLYMRFAYFKEMGCSWDHDDYKPHISIAKDNNMIPEVEPYPGVIRLGREDWSELDDNFEYNIEGEK